jgi:hypothetical protein
MGSGPSIRFVEDAPWPRRESDAKRSARMGGPRVAPPGVDAEEWLLEYDIAQAEFEAEKEQGC